MVGLAAVFWSDSSEGKLKMQIPGFWNADDYDSMNEGKVTKRQDA
jgi:hypothetical protein